MINPDQDIGSELQNIETHKRFRSTALPPSTRESSWRLQDGRSEVDYSGRYSADLGVWLLGLAFYAG